MAPSTDSPSPGSSSLLVSVRRGIPFVWKPHPLVIPDLDHPIQRLGRWDGTSFQPVAPDSITAEQVHVMSHGWAPGLGPVVRTHEEFLRVWDEAAVTEQGGRFDRWYPSLANAIIDKNPDAVVLGYSWIDASATYLGALNSARSQLYTDLAAQALTLALRAALSSDHHDLHMVGFSHGSKVVTLAGLLLDDAPRHLTLLDSPEGLLPVIGGAFNDLTPYLRAYRMGREPGETFIDTYPSAYGVHYGEAAGLGEVVEVGLDPEAHRLDDAHNDHNYANVWYCASAGHGVGLDWSPLFDSAPTPAANQLRQVAAADDPWTLETNPDVTPAPVVEAMIERVVQRQRDPIVLGSEYRRSYWTVGWRRRGDLAATSRVRWISGPPEAQVSLTVQGRERWRSRNGWSEEPVRTAVVPLGGLRLGPKISRLKLESPEPAEIELLPTSIGGFPVPTIEDLGSWVSPVARTLMLPASVLVGGTVWRLARWAGGALTGRRSEADE